MENELRFQREIEEAVNERFKVLMNDTPRYIIRNINGIIDRATKRGEIDGATSAILKAIVPLALESWCQAYVIGNGNGLKQGKMDGLLSQHHRVVWEDMMGEEFPF